MYEEIDSLRRQLEAAQRQREEALEQLKRAAAEKSVHSEGIKQAGKPDLESSDEETDEDEDIDLERDDQGNYIIFKPVARDDGDGGEENEDDDEEELSEKFTALRSTKQIQILLMTLKTSVNHA